MARRLQGDKKWTPCVPPPPYDWGVMSKKESTTTAKNEKIVFGKSGYNYGR